MDLLRSLLIILHLLSWAFVFGASFAGMKQRAMPKGLTHGAASALLTGVLLVGVIEMGDLYDLNHMKIGIKLVLAILVTVFAFIGARKEKAARAHAGAGSPDRADGYAGDTAPPAPVVHPSAAMAHLTFGAAVIAVAVAVFI